MGRTMDQCCRKPVLEALEQRLLLSGSVVISEFMASNDSTILDGDNNSSDWIELHNPTNAPININGWFLTDKTDNLDKWRIPNITLAAAGSPTGNDYVLFFASGQDGATPYWDGHNHHTNFTLSKEGENVLLVADDGATIVHSYVDYPEQITDISYGVHIGSTTVINLVDEGDGFAYRVPTPGDAPLLPTPDGGWTAEGFDDSDWSRDTVNGARRLLVTEVSTGGSEYVEIQNTSRDPVDVSGWIVLINDPTLGIDEPNSTAWSLSGTMGAGTVLSRDDAGFGGISWDTGGPGWVMILDDAGNVIDLAAWGYADADIAAMSVDYGVFTGIVPGDEWTGPGAASGPGDVMSRAGNFDTDTANDFVRSEAPTPGAQNANLTVPVGSVVPNQLGAGFANEQDEFELIIQTNVEAQMKDAGANASIWTRIEFEVVNLDGYQSLALRMKYDDGFVAYLNGVRVASSNAPVSLNTDSAATDAQSNLQAVIYEDFDITSHMGLLHVGTNVLSIHGLNFDAADDDFLLQPQLAAPSSISEPRYFGIPTPQAASDPSLGAPADEVEFSRLGGVFTEASFTVSLSTESSDTTIHYTLDGTVPTDESAEYASPLTVSNTTQIRARAYEPGRAPGPVNTESYIGLAWDIQNFNTDIPIVIIDNFGAGGVPSNTKQASHASIFEPDAGGWTSLADGHELETRAGLKTRGSSTSGQSYSVEAWGEQINDDSNISPLGMPSESDWILYSSSFDTSKMNNSFIYELSNQVGPYAVRTQHVAYFLNTGGGDVSMADYKGVFVFMEKIKRGDDRVDVERLDPSDNTEPDISGGYMFKIDRADPGDGGFSAGATGLKWVYPKEEIIETPEYDAQEQWIKNYLNEYYAALNGPGFVNPSTGLHYSDYIDVAASIDHHILNEFTKNPDEFRLSTYLYKPRGERFSFGPIWDFDRALGFEGRSDNPIGWWQDFQWGNWWPRMFNDPVFCQAWIDRWFELRETVFSHANLQSIIDTQADEIDYTATNRDGNWPSRRNELKNWVTARVNWMDSQFRPLPQFSISSGQVTPGTTVTLSASGAGSIYYTTDGTDPRTAAGGIGGQLYTGPITITDNTKIIARVYDPAATPAQYCFSRVQWGAPTELVAVVDTPADADNLAITEINYNPHDPTSAELAVNWTFTSEDFEFVEVMNTGASTIALGGVEFVDGFEFEFDGGATLTAGQRGVVVANQSAFTARYGSGITILGQYGLDDRAPHLANSGERLRVTDILDADIRNFRFNDSDAWPGRADGKGASLEVIDTAGDYGDSDNWMSSVAYGGTPGAAAAEPIGVVINEILSHTDLPSVDSIELYNTTDATIAIGGWYLSDTWGWSSNPDNGDYKKYRIPPGTTIDSGEYLVFDEYDFGGLGPLDFALDGAHGDDVWLMVADPATNLTHFADHVSFGGAANGESFGRWPDSVGGLYPMQSVTLWSPNSGPRGSGVIISEVMYNPPDPDGPGGVDPGDLEYIELYNRTIESIDLAAWEDNPHGGAQYFADWRIRGDADMEFDEGTTIAPDQALLVLSFDPNKSENNSRAAAFRAHYGIDASIPMTGGYEGHLDNDGQRITLQRPDSPPLEEPDYVPHLIEDEVSYDVAAPWPTGPNGSGDSLHRIHVDLYGNDPVSWLPNAPSPGVASSFTTPPVRINEIADVTVDEDDPNTVLDLSDIFHDPDLDETLTLSVSGNTNGGLAATTMVGTDLTLSYIADQDGSADITVRATDPVGVWVEDTFTVTVNPINDGPIVANPIGGFIVNEDLPTTAIHLANVFDDVDLPADTLEFSFRSNSNPGLVTTDLVGETLTLSYVAGQTGSADITVRATDQNGSGVWIEDSFTVLVVSHNIGLTLDVVLSGSEVDENLPAGAVVGTLDSTDPYAATTYVYTLVSGNGDDDNSSFTIEDNVLKTTEAFNFEAQNTYNIRVRSVKQGWLYAEKLLTVTVGDIDTASISGIKFEDTNGDGDRDAGEDGMGGWTIELVDADTGLVVDSQITSPDGSYFFEDLPAGDHVIREIPQHGWLRTLPVPPAHTITLAPDEIRGGVDFSSQRIPGIHGQRFDDLNTNGVRDPGEPGRDGWTVELLDPETDEILETAVTASIDLDGSGWIDPIAEQGLYSFTGLDRGPGASIPAQLVDDSSFPGFYVNSGHWKPTAGMTGVYNGLARRNQYSDGKAWWLFDDLPKGLYNVWVSWGQAPALPHAPVVPYNIYQGGEMGIFEYTGGVLKDQTIADQTSPPSDLHADGIWWMSLGAHVITERLVVEAQGPQDVPEGSLYFAFADAVRIEGNRPTYTVREIAQSGWTQTSPVSGEYSIFTAPGESRLSIDFGDHDIVAPAITVDPLTTGNPSPPLSGTVDDPDASVEITVDGNTYAASNNGDGTWTLPAGTITPALGPDSYNVAASATDPSGNIGSDGTAGELTVDSSSYIAARHVFYNNSAWDGNDPTAGPSDDAAVASDKTALLPGGTPSAANSTSYARGINGIMADIGNFSAAPVIGDFEFRISGPGGWTGAPTPSINVRQGDGVGGSDRVTFVWPDGAIANQWIEVTVLANANTGLAHDDVFHFGNAAGDIDGDGAVGQADSDALVGEFGLRGDELSADFNGDRRVDLSDFAIMRSRFGDVVASPEFPAAAPLAAPAPAAAPQTPVADQPPAAGWETDPNVDSTASITSVPTVDLLAASLSTIPAGPSAADDYAGQSTPQEGVTTPLAATSEYDLRPLNDDSADCDVAELQVDVLAASALTLPL